MDIETPKNKKPNVDLYALLSSGFKDKSPKKKEKKKKKGPPKPKFQIELEELLENFK